MANNVPQTFVDDAKIYTVIDNVNFNSSQLQHSLDLGASFAIHWQLKLSPTKNSVMRLNSKRTASVTPTYTVRGCSLPVTTQCSDLRVSYYEHLSYTSHVSKIVDKVELNA